MRFGLTRYIQPRHFKSICWKIQRGVEKVTGVEPSLQPSEIQVPPGVLALRSLTSSKDERLKAAERVADQCASLPLFSRRLPLVKRALIGLAKDHGRSIQQKTQDRGLDRVI